jgi:hypothetical protein
LNEAKSQRPDSAITAFNIVLSNGELAVTEERMHAFEDAILSSGPASATAIIAYVCSINRAQAEKLIEMVRTSPDAEVRDLVGTFC